MTPQKPPSTSKYKRGDVVLVPFPNSNLQSAKVRPALIVQADNLNTGLLQLVIAMISSKVARANHPSRVLVSISTPEGRQSGLLTDSVVMADNLATVALTVIMRAVGTLPRWELKRLCGIHWNCRTAEAMRSRRQRALSLSIRRTQAKEGVRMAMLEASVDR